MTYTGEVKNEIAVSKLNELENRNLLLGYLYVDGYYKENKLTLLLENISVARKLFRTFKYSYKMDIKMTIRTQKKFKVQRVFIFEIDDPKRLFEQELNNIDISDTESMKSFIKGIFLAAGSISDPKKNNYHLEILLTDEKRSNFILNVLNNLGFNFKMLKRDKGYMIYLKSSEEISDFLKLLDTINSLFYYEDIRIYRDHKNMVNRLNNCEQANYEKSIKTSEKQKNIINYLIENDYMSLLDEKTRQVAEYRLKYNEESFQSLANIMTNEIDKKVTKSYINHHLRKIDEIYNRIINTKENN